MEETKKKNNLWIIILILLVLILGGYIVYDKCISKEESKEKPKEEPTCEKCPTEEKGLSVRGMDFTLSTDVDMTAGTEANIVADGKKVKMTLKSDEEEDNEVYYSQELSSKVENIILLCHCGGCSSIYVLTEDKTLYGVDEYFHQDFSLLSNMKKYDIKDINSIGSMAYEYDPEDTCGGQNLYIEKTNGAIYSLDSLINNK